MKHQSEQMEVGILTKIVKSQYLVIEDKITNQHHSFAQIAREYGVSRERIRQIALKLGVEAQQPINLSYLHPKVRLVVHWLFLNGHSVETIRRMKYLVKIDGHKCYFSVDPPHGRVKKTDKAEFQVILHDKDQYVIPVGDVANEEIDVTYNALPNYNKYKSAWDSISA
jgi:ribosomal protein S14